MSSYQEEEQEDTSKSSSCPICQEDEIKDPVQLPCEHAFCGMCLEQWRSKYDLYSERTCPMCRKSIPPTREMLRQLEGFKITLEALKERVNDPRPFPPPGTQEFNDDTLETDTMLNRLGAMEMFVQLTPEQQDGAIRTSLRERSKHLESMIASHETRIGKMDVLPSISPSEAVEALPQEICKAAANNNIQKVLEWLGPEPVPPQRINAMNPDKFDRTLLAEAECECLLPLMSILLQMGAKVDPVSSFGTTPLSQACSIFKRTEPAARLLLEWGADKSWKLREREGRVDDLITTAKEVNNKSLARLLESELGGRRCEIHSLQKRTDLNGMTGVAQKYVQEKDRYVVVIEHTEEKVLVSPANLSRRDRTPEDSGYPESW